MQLHDSIESFTESANGLVIVREQEITDDLLDFLADERLASTNMRARELHLAASVPSSVVDVWLSQGRPFWQASAREIMGWLRKDGLDAFIGTSKRI